MITVNGFTFPQTLNDEVAAAVERIPVDGLLLLAKTEGLTKGFRLEPANAKVFRQRLLTHIVHPSKPMPDIVLEALRKNSFQQDFVCVLSTGALLVGYTKIARFVGEARLLFGMLLDERDEIFGKARSILTKDGYVPSPPEPSEEVRADVRYMFEPFFREFGGSIPSPEGTTDSAETGELDKTGKLQERIDVLERCERASESTIKKLSEKNEKLQRRVTGKEQEITELNTRLREAAGRENTQAGAVRQLQDELAAVKTGCETLKRELAATRRADIPSIETLQGEIDGLRRENKKLSRDLDSKTVECGRLTVESHRLDDCVVELEKKIEGLRSNNAELQRMLQSARADAGKHLPDGTRELARGLLEQVRQLAEMLDAANPKNGEVSSATRPPQDSLPSAPSGDPRARLAELTSSPFNRNDRLIFLIDGHNVLNSIEPYASDRAAGVNHQTMRANLLHDLRQIRSRVAECEMHLFYDGVMGNEERDLQDPAIHIKYSGGSPDEKHRADNRIEEYCCFLSSQGGAKLIVTVTADQELRAGVRDNGSRLIYPSDFMALARL